MLVLMIFGVRQNTTVRLSIESPCLRTSRRARNHVDACARGHAHVASSSSSSSGGGIAWRDEGGASSNVKENS